MTVQKNTYLIVAAILNAIAAFMHLACTYFGAPLLRFLGTEEMASMYESGDIHAIIACLVLTAIFFSWSAYALSGAGVIRKLPLLRLVLILISVVYIARGVFFPLIAPYFPGNSILFWQCSSLIVLLIGLIHLFGIKKSWKHL